MKDNYTAAVVDAVSGLFSDGIRIGHDVLTFAKSSLNATTPDELASLVMDPDDYGGGIIDLVFSPDESARFDIEQVLPPGGIPREYHAAIAASVAARIDSARIYLSIDGDSVRKNISEQIIYGFVRKLHLEKNLEYVRIPGRDDPPRSDMCVRARVMLRSRAFTSTPRRELFIGNMLSSLFEKDGIGESRVMDCLDYIIRVFRGIGDDIDVGLLISEKMKQDRAIIEKKKIFHEYSRTLSMEYLMPQKIFDPPESMDALTKDIQLAEEIQCLVLERSDTQSTGGQPGDGIISCDDLDGKI